jgi:hypothetical protein
MLFDVRPTHLSRLVVAGGDLEDLVRLHAEWALGLGRFGELREARLEAGVPEGADVAGIVGEHGDRWTFKFAVMNDRVARTSLIKVARVAAGVGVDHLVVRDGAFDRLGAPSADAPEVVRYLLGRLNDVEPHELRKPDPDLVDEDQVGRLVDRALDQDRRAPMIVVAVENALRTPLVDAAELAGRLAGMATVHRLASVRASYRLRDELAARGMNEKLGCYNGGVRILWPDIGRDDNPYDHLLLLPARIFAMPARSRTEQVAGVFCELMAESEDLRRWLREVEGPSRAHESVKPRPTAFTISQRRTEPDADRDAARLQVVVPPPSRREPAGAPTVEPAPSPAAASQGPGDGGLMTSVTGTSAATAVTPSLAVVAAAMPEPDALEGPTIVPAIEVPAQIATSTAEPPAPGPSARTRKSTWGTLADDVAAALQLADEQERDLDAIRQELTDARRDMRRAEQERDEIRGSLGPPRTVAGALARAEALYADRLIVLRSARASAEDSPYRDPQRVFFVLSLLAGCDAGDVGEVIHRALGGKARWKPKDSDATVATFGRDRTWVDSRGAPKMFGRHVTLGHGVSPQKCLQIYYDVLGDGRIEVAWVGEHRPTVGEDT